MYDYVAKTAKDNSYILTHLSHEINNPLNAVIGLSDLLLEEDNITEEMKECLNMIKESGVTISELTNHLTQKTNNNIIEEDIDIYECIEMVCKMQRLDAETKGLELNYEIDLKERRYKTKKIYIKQIIYNLIGNAIKYTDKGYIKVECKKDNKKVKIKIKDTGVGIPVNKMSDIFKPFTQINETKNGVGLGLHVVAELVGNLGGIITVESEYGVGSIFTVII